MFDKRFLLLFVVLVGVFTLASFDNVFAAPQGVQGLKIFKGIGAELESAVNEWLSGQNIVVNKITAGSSGNGYVVTVSYHAGGGDITPTRLKVFDSSEIGEEGIESSVQDFLASLDQTYTVRDISTIIGGYLAVFIVYDEAVAAQSVTSEAPSVPVIEKIKEFIKNVVSPFTGETSSETPAAPTEEPAATEEPTAATPITETPAAADTATATEEQSATTTTEISPEPTEETPAAPEEATTTEEQGEVLGAALISSLTASIFSAGSFLFNSQIGGIVFLLLLLAAALLINKALKKWEDKK